MYKAKVLVTDASYKHTLGAVRSLARAGYYVECIGANCELSALSKYARRAPMFKTSFSNEGFKQFLAFLSQQPYDVLLPIGGHSVGLVSKHITAFQSLCRVPLASPELIAIAFDKLATIELARNLGIKYPRTWLIEENRPSISFPLVIKRRNELHRYQPPKYVHNMSELKLILNKWHGPSPIMQEYIEGEGQGFFALYQNGKCKRVFMHRRIREVPPSGGASCCAESIFERDLLEQGMKVLDALNWHGVAMVEFKRAPISGELYLMEINPKFWGSLDLALCAGVNFPALAVQVALDEKLEYSEDYKVGLRFHWPLDGETNYIWQRPQSIIDVFKDFLDPSTKSNIRWNDPLPHLYSLVKSSHRLLRLILGAK